MKNKKRMDEVGEEIRSLNAEDLDVEELEKRLELATAGVDGDCWIMSCDEFAPPPK